MIVIPNDCPLISRLQFCLFSRYPRSLTSCNCFIHTSFLRLVCKSCLDEFDSISPSSEFLKSPHLKSRIPTYSFHLSSSTFGRKKCVSLKKTAWKVTPKTRYSYKRGTFISSVVCCLGVASEVLDLRWKVTKSDMIISKPSSHREKTGMEDDILCWQGLSLEAMGYSVVTRSICGFAQQFFGTF